MHISETFVSRSKLVQSIKCIVKLDSSNKNEYMKDSVRVKPYIEFFRYKTLWYFFDIKKQPCQIHCSHNTSSYVNRVKNICLFLKLVNINSMKKTREIASSQCSKQQSLQMYVFFFMKFF